MKNIQNYYLAMIIEGALLTVASPVVRAQDTATDGYVTRKEYEELKSQMLAMKKELDALKKEKGATAKQDTAERQAVADTHKQVTTEVAPPVVQPEGLLGTTKFLLAGWAEGM